MDSYYDSDTDVTCLLNDFIPEPLFASSFIVPALQSSSPIIGPASYNMNSVDGNEANYALAIFGPDVILEKLLGPGWGSTSNNEPPVSDASLISNDLNANEGSDDAAIGILVQPLGINHPIQHEPAGSVTLEHLSNFFHLKEDIAAKKLGVCCTKFKGMCRKLNLPRWPYRKVSSFNKKIITLEKSLEERMHGRIDDGVISLMREINRQKANKEMLYQQITARAGIN